MNSDLAAALAWPGRRARWFPGIARSREYQLAWLRPDLVAGITLAALLLPDGSAIPSLGGLPSEAGLYACLFSGLVFWFFCSSRHTAITVASAISLLIARSSSVRKSLVKAGCEEECGPVVANEPVAAIVSTSPSSARTPGGRQEPPPGKLSQ